VAKKSKRTESKNETDRRQQREMMIKNEKKTKSKA
jgi:hypothetical protein